MCENMYKKWYMTPETYIDALADALKETYYRDGDWRKKAHPEDLSMNFLVIAEAVGAFMTSIIDRESMEALANTPHYNTIWEKIKEEVDRQKTDYANVNDAYVETEDTD